MQHVSYWRKEKLPFYFYSLCTSSLLWILSQILLGFFCSTGDQTQDLCFQGRHDAAELNPQPMLFFVLGSILFTEELTFHREVLKSKIVTINLFLSFSCFDNKNPYYFLICGYLFALFWIAILLSPVMEPKHGKVGILKNCWLFIIPF